MTNGQYRLVTVNLPQHLVNRMDELVRSGLYKSRKEIIEKALNILLNGEQVGESNEDKCGDIVEVYEKPGLKLYSNHKHVLLEVNAEWLIHGLSTRTLLYVVYCPNCNRVLNISFSHPKARLACPICDTVADYKEIPIMCKDKVEQVLEEIDEIRNILSKAHKCTDVDCVLEYLYVAEERLSRLHESLRKQAKK